MGEPTFSLTRYIDILIDRLCLKNLNDDYPDMHIAYTGSSMLEIDLQQGDLSRRQMVYQLVGLSFREFLEFECGLKIRAYLLNS